MTTDPDYHKKYYLRNKEKMDNRSRSYYKENPSYYKDWATRYYQENRDDIIKKSRQYYLLNKDRAIEYSKSYRKANPLDKQHHSKICGEYYKKRRKADPLFHLLTNIRARTCAFFRETNRVKMDKTINLLGSSMEIIKEHIEKQFTEGMGWDNYGEWHIDHIIPLSSGKTEEDIIKLCHYTNLQPLWAIDNLKKGNKIIIKQTLLQ